MLKKIKHKRLLNKTMWNKAYCRLMIGKNYKFLNAYMLLKESKLIRNLKTDNAKIEFMKWDAKNDVKIAVKHHAITTWQQYGLIKKKIFIAALKAKKFKYDVQTLIECFKNRYVEGKNE